RRAQWAGCVEVGRVDLDPTFGTGLAYERRAAQIGNVVDALAVCQSVCDFADLSLAIAVDEQVGLRIQQDRTPHLLRPVVEVSDASQGGFDAADDDWNVLEGLTRALRVDDHGAIRSLSALTARRVCVVASDPA